MPSVLPGRSGRAGRRRVIRRVAAPWSVLLLWLAGAVSGAAAAGPLVLAGPDPGSIFLAQPGSHSLMILRRNGAIVVTQHLDADPAAMALDTQRGLLYVALNARRGSQILLLQAKDLRRLGMLSTTVRVTSLSAIAGVNAFYIYDAATQRPAYATYSPNGTVRLTFITGITGTSQSPIARLHVLVDRMPGTQVSGTFWASGFTPGETVTVSWGASNQGSLRADRLGVVSGHLPDGEVMRRGGYSLGLYGLSSHISLVQLVGRQQKPRRHHRSLRRPPLPAPLYLGFLPGPVAAVNLPVTHGKIRLPVGAAALPVICVVGMVGMRRRLRRAPRAGR